VQALSSHWENYKFVTLPLLVRPQLSPTEPRNSDEGKGEPESNPNSSGDNSDCVGPHRRLRRALTKWGKGMVREGNTKERMNLIFTSAAINTCIW